MTTKVTDAGELLACQVLGAVEKWSERLGLPDLGCLRFEGPQAQVVVFGDFATQEAATAACGEYAAALGGAEVSVDAAQGVAECTGRAGTHGPVLTVACQW